MVVLKDHGSFEVGPNGRWLDDLGALPLEWINAVLMGTCFVPERLSYKMSKIGLSPFSGFLSLLVISLSYVLLL
jgi:hypothetical protein